MICSEYQTEVQLCAFLSICQTKGCLGIQSVVEQIKTYYSVLFTYFPSLSCLSFLTEHDRLPEATVSKHTACRTGPCPVGAGVWLSDLADRKSLTAWRHALFCIFLFSLPDPFRPF